MTDEILTCVGKRFDSAIFQHLAECSFLCPCRSNTRRSVLPDIYTPRKALAKRHEAEFFETVLEVFNQRVKHSHQSSIYLPERSNIFGANWDKSSLNFFKFLVMISNHVLDTLFFVFPHEVLINLRILQVTFALYPNICSSAIETFSVWSKGYGFDYCRRTRKFLFKSKNSRKLT